MSRIVKPLKGLLSGPNVMPGIKKLIGHGYEEPWAVVFYDYGELKVEGYSSRAAARSRWVTVRGNVASTALT